MNLLRWIFGIPLALSISGGILGLFSFFDIENAYQNKNFFWISHFVIVLICSFLFVFLSCLFVPAKRKFAALIATIASIILIPIGLYAMFTDRYTYGDITAETLINYLCMVFGLMAGTYVSYEVFKKRRWSKQENLIGDEESY